MVGVHVVERRLLGLGELVVCRAVENEIVARQVIGLAEAAIEAGALDRQTEEGEIAEAGIELGLGMAVEIAPLGAGLLRRAALQPLRPGSVC